MGVSIPLVQITDTCSERLLHTCSMPYGQANGTFMVLPQTSSTFVWYFSRLRNVLRNSHYAPHITHLLRHGCVIPQLAPMRKGRE
jgi:hypothetical protein